MNIESFSCLCGNNDFIKLDNGYLLCSNCSSVYKDDFSISIQTKKCKQILDKQQLQELQKPTIVTCPACNQQVSNQAPSCPHCGQPIDTRPKCPTCGSPDIHKMSHIKKSASIWFWGLTSDKINKTWQCNKCGQTW